MAALLRTGVTIMVASSTSPSASIGDRPWLACVSQEAMSAAPPLVSSEALTGISAPSSTITGQLIAE